MLSVFNSCHKHVSTTAHPLPLTPPPPPPPQPLVIIVSCAGIKKRVFPPDPTGIKTSKISNVCVLSGEVTQWAYVATFEKYIY